MLPQQDGDVREMLRVRIKLHNDDHQTLELEAGRRYLFGRRKDCDVVLENFPGISRAHFCLDLSVTPYTLEVLEGSRPFLHGDEETLTLELTEAAALLLDPYTFIFELSNKPLDSNTAMVPSAMQPHLDEITQVQTTRELLPYIVFKADNRPLKLLGAHWVAGRDESSDIVLENARASRQQFELFEKDGRFYVRDLNSSHGTLLMGEAVSALTPQEIKSGDVIEVEGTSLVFELRDPSFSAQERKRESGLSSLKDLIPATWVPEKYRSPEADGPSIVLLEGENKALSRKKKIQIGAALAFVILMFLFTGEPPESPSRSPASQSESANKFESLSPEQQDIVRYSFQLADNLIKQQKFELALEQLKNIHDLIPEYENSKEMERVALQYREIRDQRDYLERQRRRIAAVNQKVQEILETCQPVAERATTLAEIEICLQPALELNPTHPAHAEMIGKVQARIDQREQAERQRAQHQARVNKGVKLFNDAKALEESGKFLEAISAYRRHIRSTHPDPGGLKAQSLRASESLESTLEQQKESLMAEARSLASAGELAPGILSAQKATQYAPNDADIAIFIDETSKELVRKLKGIYTESVLEERFGNIDAAKSKWQTILKLDLPEGEYATRAKNKLKQYGGG